MEFYQSAFGLSRRFATPDNDYGELQTGETILSFASFDLANANLKNGFTGSSQTQKPFGMELALVTEDVPAIMEKAMQLGAKLVESPVLKPWGQTVGYLQDIDGFLLEICSPIKADK